MTAIQARPNGEKVEVNVFLFKGTSNVKYRNYAGDLCVVGKNDDGSAKIRFLANFDQINTSTVLNIETSADGKTKKVTTRNSVYYLEVI